VENTSKSFAITAKTMYGFEQILAKELELIGAKNIELGNRVVQFKGTKETLYRANIQLRTALRVLIPVKKFDARNDIQLYNSIKDIDWSEYITTSDTIAVDAVVNSDKFNHSKFVALKSKDAVVDFFREKFNRRPSVNTTHPTLRINVHISDSTCTVSIDCSGESLHKRGYRVEQSAAPINEVLAAGMILLSGWNGQCNFIDPMCGSGTIVIEAAMIAYGIPPGIFRNEFAFEKWQDFDEDMFSNLIDSDEYYKDFDHKIIGSDISAQTLRIALENAKAASLHKRIELKAAPFSELEPPNEAGIIVTNPPYGERLKTHQIQEFYRRIGDTLKLKYNGYSAWIISSDLEALKRVGLRPEKRIKLINGKLDCGYYKFSVYKGSKKQKYQNRTTGAETKSE
jgi:putative N6-adenine-specific DNA methylase